MYVPNYVPEPLEVPGNITEERYSVRLTFIRRVTLLHALGLAVVGALAVIPVGGIGLAISLPVMACLFLSLDVLRILRRGRPSEARLSGYLLPLVLFVASWNLHEALLIGFPAWAVFAGPACMVVYTLLCGRDYSFVGGGVLSLIASSVLVATLTDAGDLTGLMGATALLVNAVYLVYFVYDLASLMARRRKGEEIAAVVDLYRDVFNFFGYVLRCIVHWRRHRIWNVR